MASSHIGSVVRPQGLVGSSPMPSAIDITLICTDSDGSVYERKGVWRNLRKVTP